MRLITAPDAGRRRRLSRDEPQPRWRYLPAKTFSDGFFQTPILVPSLITKLIAD